MSPVNFILGAMRFMRLLIFKNYAISMQKRVWKASMRISEIRAARIGINCLESHEEMVSTAPQTGVV